MEQCSEGGLTVEEQWTIGVDIGGTFTDVALIGTQGRLAMAKAPTTPGDPSQGVLAALDRLAQQEGFSRSELLGRAVRLTHGSTIATNALLTRDGARVGLITTKGFEDTPYIMRAIGRVDGLPEEEIRHVTWLTKPDPLVERQCIRGVPERVDVEGRVVVPLHKDVMQAAVDSLVQEERVEAVAVCFLNAWANPVHEEMVAAYLKERYGDRVYFTYSARLARVAGEYARMNTTLVDCFVGPKVHQYLARLEQRLRSEGFRGTFLLMQGNGGLTSRDQCTPVSTLQSGPAGGMLAAAYMAHVLDHRYVLTADMGGTSFDVGIFAEGYWKYASEPIFDRFRILQPIIEIDSIGAGGGTIAKANPDVHRLIVGPASAGAEPGPACYGHGGTDPTVTDANLALGILDPHYFLGGAFSLYPEKAQEALRGVGEALGMKDLEVASGIHEIITSKMADLIRRQVIRSGYLPEEFVLYAYGGAAAIHAVGFARELGIQRVYVFPTSPVFSAFGIAMADVVHTRVMTCQYALPVEPSVLNDVLDQLEGGLAVVMEREGFRADTVQYRRYATLRFRRQMIGVEIELPWDRFDAERMASMPGLFLNRYEALYGSGSGNPEAGIDLGAIRVDAVGVVSKPSLPSFPLAASMEPPVKGERRIYMGGAWQVARVYDWETLQAGQMITPWAVVESPFTTVMVPQGATATVDPYRNLVLQLTA